MRPTAAAATAKSSTPSPIIAKIASKAASAMAPALRMQAISAGDLISRAAVTMPSATTRSGKRAVRTAARPAGIAAVPAMPTRFAPPAASAASSAAFSGGSP